MFSGCCGTAAQTDDGEPALATAGWESAGGEPAALKPLPMARSNGTGVEQDEELAALRQSNAQLMNTVAELMTDVERIEAERAAAAKAVEVVVAPAPAPVQDPSLTVEGVREILHGESLDNLPVSMNTKGKVVISLPGSMCFASGKSEVQRSAQTNLARLVAGLRDSYPDLKIRAEGHTDSDPIRKSKWASNMALSEARAASMAKYLVLNTGMDEANVSSVGFGATRPIASNATSKGKAQNRRVDLVLIP
jgi:chemotaxis protein MotB